ncbi:MAG: substrate-binding domain-containing protein [Bacteroidetes bacterium]|nr:substrate-binding domain-containing protein [Bacteroidota bacterium]
MAKNILAGLVIMIGVASCGEDVEQPADTPSSGTIDISVDDTYKPIIDEQKKVFDSSFPEAHINVHYKPESECIKDFMEGKARLILVTRDLADDEKKVLEYKKIVPASLPIAKDAVAVIVNNATTDSAFTMSQIRGILTGVYKDKYTVVFDNQGSSTLRYVMDSILRGDKLGANVYAAKGNDSVIDYVSKNPKAIGFTSVSYVSDLNDPNGLAFIKNVKVAYIVNEKNMKPYQPYQYDIAPDDYQLTRKLYYIHKETYPGLGRGFANFLAGERGQLIFKQARLFPLRMNVMFREAEVNHSKN